MATNGDVMKKTFVPSNSVPNNRGFIGGLYIRPFGPFKAGHSEQGHQHYIDHATLVLSGAVRIETPSGVWEVEAPNFMHVPKDVSHKLTAMRDGTVWYCLFAEAEATKMDAEGEIPFDAKFHDAR